MSEWRNKGQVFDLLSDEEINEAKIAKSVVKRGGSLKFMFEIKNNPQKYPNISKLKNDALRILHDELGSKLPKQEPIDPRLIGMPTEEERNHQYELDKSLEFANTNKGVKKMKIKLSKSQWEMVGRKAGWMKKSQQQQPLTNGVEQIPSPPAQINNVLTPNKASTYDVGALAKQVNSGQMTKEQAVAYLTQNNQQQHIPSLEKLLGGRRYDPSISHNNKYNPSMRPSKKEEEWYNNFEMEGLGDRIMSWD